MVEYKTVALVAFAFIIAFLSIALITSGFQGVENLILVLVLVIGGLLGIFGIFYIVWYFKFRHVSPIWSKEVKRDYIASARLSGSPHLRDLWIGGDRTHQGVSLGRLFGWMRDTKILDLDPKAYDKMTTTEQRENYLPLTPEKQLELWNKGVRSIAFDFSHFAVKQHGLLKIFSDLEDCVAIENAWSVTPAKKEGQEPILTYLPELTGHSQLSGDVELYCVSVKKVGEHYWPNTLANSRIVDLNITMDSVRKHDQYVLNLVGAITDKSVGFNPMHLMALEREKLLDKSREGSAQAMQ
jgi:hypothetical protein